MFEGGWRGDTIDAMATAAEAAKTHRRRPVVYSYAYGPGLLANSGLPTGSPPSPSSRCSSPLLPLPPTLTAIHSYDLDQLTPLIQFPPPPPHPHSNPYDLGWVGNFREAFDAHGRLWMLTWMLPSRRRKRGSGFQPPRRPKARASALAAAASLLEDEATEGLVAQA